MIRKLLTLTLCLVFFAGATMPAFAERHDRPEPAREHEKAPPKKAPPKKGRSATRASEHYHESNDDDDTDDSLLAALFEVIILANSYTSYGDHPYDDEGFVFSFLNPLQTDKFWTLDVGVGGFVQPNCSSGGTKFEFRGNFLPFVGIISEAYLSTGTFGGLGGYSFTDDWTWSTRIGLSLPIIQATHMLWSVNCQYISQFGTQPDSAIALGSTLDIYPVKPLSIKAKTLVAIFDDYTFSEWELTAGVMFGGLECYAGGTLTVQNDYVTTTKEYFDEANLGIIAGVRYYF